jgi:hypothetical protein
MGKALFSCKSIGIENQIRSMKLQTREFFTDDYSEDKGNSFAPNGLSSGSSLHSVSSKYSNS